MLHDIAPHVFVNTFKRVNELSLNDYILCFHENKIMLKTENGIATIPQRKDISGLSDHHEESIYLFSLNNCNCFLTKPPANTSGFSFEDVFTLRNGPLQEMSWIGSVAFHLMTWYNGNQFCGKCGSKNTLKEDERALVCEKCDTIVYPKIAPAVIVAITCKDKILLAQGRHYKGNFYSLIAGYVDMGESLEQALIREVKEEIGISVKNIRYYASQPWPFSGSLMVGFFAEADEAQPICIDENEIIHAAWFTKENMPLHASNVSIAGEMIETFLKGKDSNY